MTIGYHPDAQINAEITQQAIEAERIDLAIGYPPRAWTCPCGAMHTRGHFLTIGTHRCLACGYVGMGGVMHGSSPSGPHNPTLGAASAVVIGWPQWDVDRVTAEETS